MQSFELKKMLMESGLAPVFVNYITGAVDRIYEIISSSGVQISNLPCGLAVHFAFACTSPQELKGQRATKFFGR